MRLHLLTSVMVPSTCAYAHAVMHTSLVHSPRLHLWSGLVCPSLPASPLARLSHFPHVCQINIPPPPGRLGCHASQCTCCARVLWAVLAYPQAHKYFKVSEQVRLRTYCAKALCSQNGIHVGRHACLLVCHAVPLCRMTRPRIHRRMPNSEIA